MKAERRNRLRLERQSRILWSIAASDAERDLHIICRLLAMAGHQEAFTRKPVRERR